MSTYAEKLKDPRWQRLRLQILERDEWTCQWCGDTKTTLHVHHEAYEGADPWDTDKELLTTVCADCHSIEHLGLNDLEKFLYKCVRSRDWPNTESIKRLNKIVRRMKA